MGKIACIILGIRSLAGLIAYPVGPPKDKPMPKTNNPTGKAPMAPNPILAPSKLAPLISGEATQKTVKTRTKVPINSARKLSTVLGIAGAVAKVPSLAPLSSVIA